MEGDALRAPLPSSASGAPDLWPFGQLMVGQDPDVQLMLIPSEHGTTVFSQSQEIQGSHCKAEEAIFSHPALATRDGDTM